MKATQITVNAPSGAYAVYCGRGLLGRTGSLITSLRDVKQVFVITSPRVFKHWGKQLQASLREIGAAKVILFDDAEAKKNLATVEQLCRALAREGADRKTVIVALGGGVVGDVAGFVGASYARGIRVVQIPTTLVAQVDSAIGGKTGVNLPEGKNLVGAFHQPRLVITDLELLKSLPEREFRSGLYEMIKYGAIADKGLFERLGSRMKDILRQASPVLDEAVATCIEIKARVVSEDERESGPRMILNFGHTFGHALEAVTKYRLYLHGEAVGWGMMAAARLSLALGLCNEKASSRVQSLIYLIGRIPKPPRLTARGLLEAMRADKKAMHGKLRFVLLEDIGRVRIVEDVPEQEVLEILNTMLPEARKPLRLR
jgi:3-dehydroquinate synthase